MNVDLQKYFTTVNNIYPKYRPQTLHLLYNYSKIAVPKTPSSYGPSFAQGDSNKVKGGRGVDNKRGRDNKTYYKKYWKYK